MQYNFRPLLPPLDSRCHGLWVPLQNCFLWIHLFIASVKKPPHHKTDPEGLLVSPGKGVELGKDWSTRLMRSSWGSWGGSACRKGSSGGAFLLSQLPERRLQSGGIGFSSQVTSDRTRGNSLELCWGDLDWILGKISSLKGWSNIGRDCPG